MMTTAPKLKDILYEFCFDLEVPTAKDTLAHYIELYPQYAKNLTEFAAYWLVEALAGDE